MIGILTLCGLILIAGLSACGDRVVGNNNSQSSAIADCLWAAEHRYADLLTKEDVAKHVAIDEATYKREIADHSTVHGSCTYTWSSDRPGTTMEVMGISLPLADNNFVRITDLDFYTDTDGNRYPLDQAMEYFENSYGVLSAEDYDVRLASLKRAYKDDEAGFRQSKKFLDARRDMKFNPVADLGDRAYYRWHEQHGITLYVLTGVAKFTIESKTAADEHTAADDAVKFAREVLAKCND